MEKRAEGYDTVIAHEARRQQVAIALQTATGDERKELQEELEELKEFLKK